MAHRLPLEGFYLYLVRNGFPLSVQDYQDALAALRLGHGLHKREKLQWLCETLWARSDEERMRLRRLFQEFPWPTSEVLANLTRSQPDTTKDQKPPEKPTRDSFPEETPPGQETPEVQFLPPTESGVGLPRANIPPSAIQAFILTPRPVVSLRTLTVTWRRFRLARRSGPKVEIDLDATIAEQCRCGLLAEPVLIPARRNQARLLVLLDASPQMATWAYLGRMLAESLERGQLGHAALYYFNREPSGPLFLSDWLTRPLPFEEVAKQHPDCAVLVISEGGAVAGHIDGEREENARHFIACAAEAAWQPVAWANPMPRRRWAGTTAQRLAALPGLAMFEFSEDGLVQAVDYLRGKGNG